MIKVHHAYELLQLLHRGGCGKFLDGLDFGWEWSDTLAGDSVSEKIYLRDAKKAFLNLHHQAVFFQAIEQCQKVVLVFCRRVARDEYVVQVYENEVQPCQRRIHEPLESLCCVLQPEGHT